jgi:elongation factor P hydroxylase
MTIMVSKINIHFQTAGFSQNESHHQCHGEPQRVPENCRTETQVLYKRSHGIILRRQEFIEVFFAAFQVKRIHREGKRFFNHTDFLDLFFGVMAHIVTS